MLLVFFFFKQKTAYELRISDWSSDVCSSDLAVAPFSGAGAPPDTSFSVMLPHPCVLQAARRRARHASQPHLPKYRTAPQSPDISNPRYVSARICSWFDQAAPEVFPWRSEEHTSELQQLMRISYSVFGLKKILI